MNVSPGRIKGICTGIPALLLTLFLFGSLFGCSGGGTETGNPKMEVGDGALFSSFSSDAEAEVYLKKSHAENLLPADAYDSERDDAGGEDGLPAPDEAESPPLSDPVSNDKGGTGRLADSAAAEDGTLYAVQERRISIVYAHPAPGMEETGGIDVDGRVLGLHLFGDTLAVLYRPDGSRSPDGDLSGPAGVPDWVVPGVRTGLLLFDVSDPAAPALVQETDFDGIVVGTRQHMGTLRLIGQFVPDLPELDQTYEDEAGRQAAAERNRQLLEGYGIGDLLPGYVRRDAQGHMDSGLLVQTDDLYRPGANAGGSSICYILSLSLNAPRQRFSAVGLAADVGDWHIAPDVRTVYLTALLRDAEGISAPRIFTFEAENGRLLPEVAGSVQGNLARSALSGPMRRKGMHLTDCSAGRPFPVENRRPA